MKGVILEVSGLKKHYGQIIGIDDVGFKLNSEQILGFIGPNGSGKSTTIKTLLGLLKADSGNVKIFNKELSKNFSDIMQFVGYLPSEVSGYENLTAKALLTYAASFYEVNYQANIYKLAAKLQLDLNLKIKEMSFGNKKKVGLINALFHEPKLIILDEPTNGLDPLAANELMNLLKEEKQKGAGILFSSNNLNDVSYLCDNIMVIKNGKIISTFDKKDLRQTHKKITIEAAKLIEEKNLNLNGIKDLKINEKQASFLFAGDINDLIKKLHSLSLVNISINESSLDELFLHYYE